MEDSPAQDVRGAVAPSSPSDDAAVSRRFQEPRRPEWPNMCVANVSNAKIPAKSAVFANGPRRLISPKSPENIFSNWVKVGQNELRQWCHAAAFFLHLN
jgi:hypothetical protein